MKILATGDLHLTDKRPVNRTDDYGETVLKKFEFILQTACKENCDLILQPMDFFDNPSPSYGFWSKVYNLIFQYQKQIITDFGQHDMRQRNKDSTGLSALLFTNPLLHRNVHTRGPMYRNDRVDIYCSPYNSEILFPVEKNNFNILLAHRMVVAEKLWEDQKNFVYGSKLLEQYPDYNLMITGDNHQNFIVQKDDRVLINAGSMMRSVITQSDHIPRIYIIEIENKAIKNLIEIDIPIAPASQVLRLDHVEKEKLVSEDVRAYIDGLKGHKSQDLQFDDDLNHYLKENKVEDSIVEILNQSKGE